MIRFILFSLAFVSFFTAHSQNVIWGSPNVSGSDLDFFLAGGGCSSDEQWAYSPTTNPEPSSLYVAPAPLFISIGVGSYNGSYFKAFFYRFFDADLGDCVDNGWSWYYYQGVGYDLNLRVENPSFSLPQICAGSGGHDLRTYIGNTTYPINGQTISTSIPYSPGNRTYSGVVFTCSNCPGGAISGTTLNSNVLAPNSTYYLGAEFDFIDERYYVYGQVTTFGGPTISNHPTNQTACPGSTVSFTVSGVNFNNAPNVDYQWQIDTGFGFNDITGGYTGFFVDNTTATSATLSFTANSTMHGYRYRCVVRNNCGTPSSVISGAATLGVFGQVGINHVQYSLDGSNYNTLPGALTLCRYSPLWFTAAGSSSQGGVSYMWQYKYPWEGGFNDWNANQVFEISNTPHQEGVSNTWHGLQVRVRMRDGCGAATETYSAPVALSFFNDPVATQQPVSRIVCPSGASGAQSFTFLATPQNGSIAYQWEYWTGSNWQAFGDGIYTAGNGADTWTGTNNGTLTLSTTISDIPRVGQLRSVAKDGCPHGYRVSNQISYTVPAGPTITTSPSNQTVCAGQNVTFSGAATSGNGTVNYAWEFHDGANWIASPSSVFPNITGDATPTLTITNNGVSHSGNRRVRFYASDNCGSSNRTLSGEATLYVLPPPTITTSPANQTVCAGTNVTFSGAATSSNGTVNYDWEFFDGASWIALPSASYPNITGDVTANLTIANPSTSYNNTRVRFYASDNCGVSNRALSGEATLSVLPPTAITTQPGDPDNTGPVGSASVCLGSTVIYTLVGTGHGTLTYQWFKDGTAITGATSATLVLSGVTAANAGTYVGRVISSSCGFANTDSRVLTVSANTAITAHPASPTLCNNAGSSFTVAASGSSLTYQWQERLNASSTWNNLSNGGNFSGTTTATLLVASFPIAANGNSYRAIVTGTCGSATSNIATVTVLPSPLITTEPISNVTCRNSTAVFSVAASGTSLTYQWQFNGTGTWANMTGKTSATLTLAGVTESMAGQYRLNVTNSCGTTTSIPASLTVNPVTSIASQTNAVAVCPGQTISATVTAGGTAPFTYQWQRESPASSGTFVNVADANASGVTSASLSISNANSLSAGLYRVVVSGACGANVTSSNVTVTVNPIPVEPTVTDVSRCGDGLLATTASSTSTAPAFRWFANLGDVTPVFTGPTYTINNLTVTTSLFVSQTVLGCESTQKRVTFTRNANRDVTFTPTDLSLCLSSGPRDLELDINEADARGGSFSWIAGGNAQTGKIFNPSVGVGTYIVTYTPTATSRETPLCYNVTNRTIRVIASGGTGTLAFNTPNLLPGNVINTCVGDDPLIISDYPNLKGGTWSVVSGSGINPSGSATVFTPNSSSFTATNPNVFRYSFNEGGCAVALDLSIFVKDNGAKPVITGLPNVICPGSTLTLTASVTVPGTFTYEWYRAGTTTPFDTRTALPFTVERTENLFVRSVNSPFGCRSEATTVAVNTPFAPGAIQASKSLVNVGEFVKFTYDLNNPNNTYEWTFGDGGRSREQSPAYYFYVPGIYTVKLRITSNLGCVQNLEFKSITVQGDEIKVVTGDPKDPFAGVRSYPNPVEGSLTIESEEVIRSYALLDGYGRIVRSAATDAKRVVVPFDQAPAGLYLVRLTIGSEVMMIKTIKK